MKKCHTCKKEIIENKIFCNKHCYFLRSDYGKHSEETKKKIAIGNSKPMTVNRKLAMSNARTYKPSQTLLEKLEQLWSFRYLSPCVIKEAVGLKNSEKVYKRLFKTYCKIDQFKFMPGNWQLEHYQKLIELATQNVWFKTIAKILGFGQKQVYHISKKLNLPINTRDPNVYSSITSKPELLVISWIKNEGYDISTQYPLGNFLYDCHVKNTNILIEVNGDYWHCNPKVYTTGAINEMQKSHIRRDFAKKGFASKQGYYLITVWEKDINENSEKTKSWVLGKIKTNIVEK